jgi:ketosteroid isomerase-like protein
MRCAVYGGLVAVLVASMASAQATPAAKAPKQTFAELATTVVTKLEDSWASALVRRDRATFERLLAPKFVYTEDSTTMDRATVLRGMFTDVVTEAHNDSMEVHIFNNIAVVTGWLVTKGHGKDGEFERRYRFTDVWIPRSGSWQIVAAQDYLVPVKK